MRPFRKLFDRGDDLESLDDRSYAALAYRFILGREPGRVEDIWQVIMDSIKPEDRGEVNQCPAAGSSLLCHFRFRPGISPATARSADR